MYHETGLYMLIDAMDIHHSQTLDIYYYYYYYYIFPNRIYI